MRLNIATLRWLLVIPAALFAFPLVFYAAYFAYYISGGFFTPLFVYVVSAFTAVLTVLFGSYMAPAYRSKVAVVVFLLGAICAISIAVDIKAWVEILVAIGSGFIATVVVYIKEQFTNAA